jgi:hypothetical protein
MQEGMLVRTFAHLTTQAMALMSAVPFFLTVSSPFIGR